MLEPASPPRYSVRGATRTEFQARAHIENIRLLRFGVMEAASVAEVGYRAMMAGKRVVVPGLYNKASPVGPVIAEQPDGENGESHVAARKISSVTKL